MKRKIIEINEEKCTGCGLCIPNCPEGALQIIDGKARLVCDLFCDGLGACIGECPLGAIRTIEREAEPYDECRVMENIIKQGANTIEAHLKHLKSHGEMEYYRIATEMLKERGLSIPMDPMSETEHKTSGGGCPGMLAKFLEHKTPTHKVAAESRVSALRQWPIQLQLLNPSASYFDEADLLISADCVAHAYGEFHRDFLEGKILIVFCPKLDQTLRDYVDKLTEIFRRHKIRSITILRMEVPCCGGTVSLVQQALTKAEKQMEICVKIIGIDGTIK